jgi:6-phosphogluconolactonase
MEKDQFVFVGTYTQPIKFGTGEILYGKGKGIDILKFNPETGFIKHFATKEGVANPSYLVFSNSKKYLYAVNELKEYMGEATGTVSAFRIDRNTGNISFINLQKTGGTDPCHVNISKDDKYVFVSNFMSGSVCVFPTGEDGALKEPVQFIQHEGSSVNVKRQNGPHAHSLTLDKNNDYAFVPDLGIDKLMIYKIDFENHGQVLIPQGSLKLSPGSGPRHCEFDASYRHCYLINELASSISVFDYGGKGGFELKQTVSTLGEPYEGDNICADIHLTPNGRFLYGSNRGHNSIAIYNVDEHSGMLTYINTIGCGGKTPRNFAIDPSGRFLLVANQDSNNIVSFAINEKDGTLSEVMRLESPTPVCVKFF